LVIPALVFNPDTLSRVLQFLFFWLLSFLAGKKNRPLLTLLVILGIVGFNLLVPYGRVLFSLGPLRVSSGALLAGLRRAVTLEGLIMLSRVCVRPDLRLPGRFGELIGESLRLFTRITEGKRPLRRASLVADLDRLLLELSGDRLPEGPGAGAPPLRRSTLPGLWVIAAVCVLSWLPWVFILRG
jgi:heptaprenyl diphosphate synthase